uniref:Uncharacterized protein n=1 Tax=Moniliophthora roreri TaxID=221103 RepID=A0A0W0G4B9_MONRR
MYLLVVGVAACGVASYPAYVPVAILYRPLLNPPLRNIPGPNPPSWLYGNTTRAVVDEKLGCHFLELYDEKVAN